MTIASCNFILACAPAPAAHLGATGEFLKLYPWSELCKQLSEGGVSTGRSQTAIVVSLSDSKGQKKGYHRLKGEPKGNVTF